MISSSILSDPEIRRFGKQISLPQIGLEGQENIKKARVAVIGAGGLGTSVLQYLAASGVGTLGIIDYSLVEETTVQRQTLYGGNDLGKLKTIISKQNLQNLFPLVKVEIVNLQLTSGNIDRIVKSYDLVIDSTNDPVSNKVIFNACQSLKLPWIFASLNNFEGRISVIDFKKQFPAQDVNVLDVLIPNTSKKEAGTLSIAYGFFGNLMTLEAIKFLIHNSEVLINKVLYIDMLSYSFIVKPLYQTN